MAVSSSDFEYISQLARERAALILEPGKEYLVESRLSPLARDAGYDSLEDLVAWMRANPYNGIHGKVVEALLTHETFFFRDISPFDALRTLILPALREKLAMGRRPTIWSAACSSGQEAYSIAMLLNEFYPDLVAAGTTILATDISEPMLARTRSGIYNTIEINRGLPAHMLMKYFDHNGIEWQVRAELRKMVDVRYFNLVGDWSSIPLMDVVFMRNVLIYFDTDTKKKILSRVRSVLRPDGYLFLGTAETTMNLDDSWRRVPYDRASFYQVG